jgi:ABC-2 type transport system permease protein
MKSIEMFKYEWKVQFSNLPACSVFLIFAGLLFYGGFAGKAERDARISVIEAHEATVSETMEAWLVDLRSLEQGNKTDNLPPTTGSAMDVVFASSLPQEPLSDFAVGQSDLLPFVGEISLWEPDIRLFSKYEFADPVGLAQGSFDISKAVILFLPLLLIVFCFDVISAERDSNRLSLTILQVKNLRRLFWQRMIFRTSIVLGFTLMLALIVLLINSEFIPTSDRMVIFGIWTFAVLFYGIFWCALIALVASFNHSGEYNVLALLGMWVGLTLIIPAAGSSVAEILYPTPSRLAYLAEAREVENATRLRESDVANEFMLEHPELLVNLESEFPARVSSAFLITSTVDEATRPIVTSFEEALSEREGVLRLFSYLSPAVGVHGSFNEIAGTSSRRHQSYLRQARNFKASYAGLVGPDVVAKRPVSSELFESVSPFEFIEDTMLERLNRSISPIIFFLLLSIGMLVVTNRRLKSINPIS